MNLEASQNENRRHLSDVPTGEMVRVEAIEGGQGVKSRLASLGMMVGVEIRVIRNDHRGPFIVEVKGSRVILGRGMIDSVGVA